MVTPLTVTVAPIRLVVPRKMSIFWNLTPMSEPWIRSTLGSGLGSVLLSPPAHAVATNAKGTKHLARDTTTSGHGWEEETPSVPVQDQGHHSARQSPTAARTPGTASGTGATFH